MNVSAEVALKAAKISEEGRVHQISDWMYRVEGDHDSYVVQVSYAPEVAGVCSCPAGKRHHHPCSHLIAACAFHLVIESEGRQERHLKLVTADPFAGLE